MLRLATIGTSSITRRTIAAASRVEGLRFTTATSRDADRAAALAREAGLEHSTGDLDALLAGDTVDAVYVASPNAAHADQVEAALRAGKHVLVEKPAVGSASEWDALGTLAAERGLVLMENMRTAHDPVLERIEGLLPRLGPIRRASLHLSQRSARYDDVLAGRPVNVFDPAAGGGALADLGVYCLYPAVRWFGVPDRVGASLVTLPTGADGAGAAVLGYDGLVAEIGWSKITSGDATCAVEGELGTLTFDHVTEMRSFALELRDGTRLSDSPHKEPDNITYALRRFARAVGDGGGVEREHAWTRGVLEVIERVRGAATR